MLGTVYSSSFDCKTLGSYLGDGLVGEVLLLVGGVLLRDGKVLPLHVGVIELILKRISWFRVGRKRLWWGTG